MENPVETAQISKLEGQVLDLESRIAGLEEFVGKAAKLINQQSAFLNSLQRRPPTAADDGAIPKPRIFANLPQT